MSDISERILAKLGGHDHADWCREPCDCRPGASPSELAAAIRDVLDLCDDDNAPPMAEFVAESIRLTIATRLRIVDATEVNQRMTALASRLIGRSA